MKEKRRIPYGVGNWAKLVRDDAYFYVDHTAYIRELEKFETPVFLRPRRFGKRGKVERLKSGRVRGTVRATVTAADRRQVAAYAADVAANHPGRTVEAYVAAIVGNRAYALSRVHSGCI